MFHWNQCKKFNFLEIHKVISDTWSKDKHLKLITLLSNVNCRSFGIKAIRVVQPACIERKSIILDEQNSDELFHEAYTFAKQGVFQDIKPVIRLTHFDKLLSIYKMQSKVLMKLYIQTFNDYKRIANFQLISIYYIIGDLNFYINVVQRKLFRTVHVRTFRAWRILSQSTLRTDFMSCMQNQGTRMAIGMPSWSMHELCDSKIQRPRIKRSWHDITK